MSFDQQQIIQIPTRFVPLWLFLHLDVPSPVYNDSAIDSLLLDAPDLEMRGKLDSCSGKSEALLTCLPAVLEPRLPMVTLHRSRAEHTALTLHILSFISQLPPCWFKGKYVSQRPGLVCLYFLFSLLKQHSRNLNAYYLSHFMPFLSAQHSFLFF